MAAVEIVFSNRGLPEIKAAIAGVQASLEKLAKTSVSAQLTSASTRVASEKRVLSETEKAAKAEGKALTDAAAGVEKAYIRSEKEKTAASKRETRERARDAEQYVRDIRQHNDWEAKQFEDNERRKTAAVKAEASKRKAFVGGASDLIGGAMGRTGRTIARAATALALGGGFMIAQSLHEGIKQQALGGTIFREAAQRGNFRNGDDVVKSAQSAGIKSGKSTDEMLEGINQFVNVTGDLGKANALLTDMAKLSSAVGANFGDVANMAAEVFTKVKDVDKTGEIMRQIGAQGKVGALPMKELHEYGMRIAAGGPKFAGDIGTNITSLGAVAQMARLNGANPAEATKAIENLAMDAAKKAGKFGNLPGGGVDVFSDKSKTSLKPPEQIIMESVAKTHGNMSQLNDAYGLRSIKAVMGFQAAYKTYAGNGNADEGGRLLSSSDSKVRDAAAARGEAGMRAEVGKITNTHLSKNQVEEDNASALTQVHQQVTNAMTQLQQTINTRLLPELPKLIAAFVTMIPTIGKIIDLFVEMIPTIRSVIDFFTGGSWVGGLGKIIGAIFLAELTKGGLSMAASAGGQFILAKIAAMLGIGGVPGAGAAVATSAAAEVTTGAGAGLLAGAGAGVGAVATGMALPLAVIGGGLAYGYEQQGEGSDMMAKAMGMSEGTPEEKRAKMEALGPLLARAEKSANRKGYGDVNMTGVGEGDEFGLLRADTIQNGPTDEKGQGMAKSMEAVRAELELLKKALADAANSALDASGNLKKIDAGDHPPGPPPQWIDH